MEKRILISDIEKSNNQKVFKAGKKQILLVKSGQKYFAIDNRCPHEGYPLSQGDINQESCTLTCNWHNWKFKLEDGECILGGDDVITYPVTIQGNEAVVDLSGPPKEVIERRILKGLKEAFEKNQYGRLAREITRLQFNNLDPLESIKKSILWSFDRLEYGTTHAYAAMADWLQIYQNSTDLNVRITALTEAVDYVSFDSLRHPQYLYASRKVEFDREELEKAVEKEDGELAESIVNAGFDEGKTFSDFYPTLCRLALAHYQDFGHSAIYVYKSKQISEFLRSSEIDRALTLAMIRGLVYATREDLIPEFRQYAATLKSLESLSIGKKGHDQLSVEATNIKESFSWLEKNYPHYDFLSLYKGLYYSNAQNYLRYDLKYQADTQNTVKDNVGWLSFTHAMTFSNAVHTICNEFPELWPQGLLQMAAFYGRNKPYTSESIALEQWKVEKPEEFKVSVGRQLLDHGFSRPIYSAHYLKTSTALFEENSRLNDSRIEDISLAALNRFLNSPLKQKHVARLVNQAIDLVSKDFD